MNYRILGFYSLLAVSVLSGGRAEEKAKAKVDLSLPDLIKVSSNETLLVAASASGVQIYECQPKESDPGQYQWVFKAPDAQLLDVDGKKIGRHYAGPTWESNDGSKVVGEVKAHMDSANSNAIPWLLLQAKSHVGDGQFSKVTSIQRVDTGGGIAPTIGCDKSNVGKEIRVPYTALYYFYVEKPKPEPLPGDVPSPKVQ
jgi:hypothetical protein